jgi:hypothetical protein
MNIDQEWRYLGKLCVVAAATSRAVTVTVSKR